MFGNQFNMPVDKIFSESELQELLDMNAAPPHGQRNAALIIGAVYWGLNPVELSQLKVKHVLDKRGQFYRIWTLPAETAYNGEARELHTENHVLPFFEAYIEQRTKSQPNTVNDDYRGIEPESNFFLNDRGSEFSLSPRKKGEQPSQPASMNNKLKQLIAHTRIKGATPSTFRDTFVKNMYEAGCGYAELMKVSGIKGKDTLDRKIRPHQRELEEVFKTLFSRVKVPASN